MFRSGLSLLLAAACLASSAAMAGQFTSFTVPGAKNTVATSINASGVVAGFYSSTAHKDGGFVRTPDGTITTFSVPGFKSTTPAAINSAGAITGYSGAEQSFVREPDGSFEVFQIDGARYTTATAINASGYVSGTFSNADNSGGSFRRAPNGTFFIVSASNDAQTSVYGLNDANAMAGQIGFGSSSQGFVFNGGAVVTLDAGTSLTTINDPGLAAGIQVRDNDDTRGLTLDMHGHVKLFGPKVSDMDVGHIDSAGNVVGDYLDRRSRFHGFVYSTGSGVFTRIDEPDAGHRQPFAGTRITGSNDSGVLAGFYMSNRYKNTAFIWTP